MFGHMYGQTNGTRYARKEQIHFKKEHKYIQNKIK